MYCPHYLNFINKYLCFQKLQGNTIKPKLKVYLAFLFMPLFFSNKTDSVPTALELKSLFCYSLKLCLFIVCNVNSSRNLGKVIEV